MGGISNNLYHFRRRSIHRRHELLRAPGGAEYGVRTTSRVIPKDIHTGSGQHGDSQDSKRRPWRGGCGGGAGGELPGQEGWAVAQSWRPGVAQGAGAEAAEEASCVHVEGPVHVLRLARVVVVCGVVWIL